LAAPAQTVKEKPVLQLTKSVIGFASQRKILMKVTKTARMRCTRYVGGPSSTATLRAKVMKVMTPRFRAGSDSLAAA
jgi:hypothetical protein